MSFKDTSAGGTHQLMLVYEHTKTQCTRFCRKTNCSGTFVTSYQKRRTINYKKIVENSQQYCSTCKLTLELETLTQLTWELETLKNRRRIKEEEDLRPWPSDTGTYTFLQENQLNCTNFSFSYNKKQTKKLKKLVENSQHMKELEAMKWKVSVGGSELCKRDF